MRDVPLRAASLSASARRNPRPARLRDLAISLRLRGLTHRASALIAARPGGRQGGDRPPGRVSVNIATFRTDAGAPDAPATPQGSSMASNLHDLPDSPCIGVCSTLFDDICKGCGRTAVEVSNWVFLSDEEKRAVWERIEREGTAMRFQKDRA